MKRLPMLLLGLVSLPALGQKSAGFAGTWTIRFELFGNAMPETCTLRTEGKTLQGTCKMQGNEMEAAGEADIVGELEGKDISFRHVALFLGNSVPLSFTGTVADDGSFSGKVGIDAFNVDTPFTAKPAAPQESGERTRPPAAAVQ